MWKTICEAITAGEMGCQEPHEIEQTPAPEEEQPHAPVHSGGYNFSKPAGKKLGRK